jgi:carbonic anhydrase/acetyltransferase-like protein (isoleucine patch superfamily)
MGNPPHRIVLGRDVYIAPTAYVGGDVAIGDECTIMHHAVIRGDVAAIRLGSRVNIQDGCILHCNSGVDLTIGDEVVVGHRAVVHCRAIGARALIGIGALILDDAEVGSGAIVAPGAVVPPGMRVPEQMVALGVPARAVRAVRQADRAYHARAVSGYLILGRMHAAGEYPNVAAE